MKNRIVSKTKQIVRRALFYIFARLFNGWL